MAGEFEGKNIVVTGGNRGIGAATAIEFARQGAANVAIVSTGKRVAEIETVAHEIEQLGAKAFPVSADLSDVVSAQQVIAQAKEGFGSINVLVNNAGITRDGIFTRMSPDDWDAVLETNLRPAMFLVQEAFNGKVFARAGREYDANIVNVSSLVALTGNSGQENYAAAKAGLIGLTRSYARDLGRRGIRINAVAPGFIDTEMTQNIPSDYREETIRAVTELTPLGRLGTPQDVADAITFLASPRASFITGQAIVLDGGLGGSLNAVGPLTMSYKQIGKLKGSAPA